MIHVNIVAPTSITRKIFLFVSTLWRLIDVILNFLLSSSPVCYKTWKHATFSSHTPINWEYKEGGVKLPWSVSKTLSLYWRFFSFSLLMWHWGSALLRYRFAFGSNTLTSKNACWPLTENPLDFISTLALLLALAVRFSNVSPVTGSSFDSISTCLHTSAGRFAVKSWRSLCLIVTNPPFLQLIECWMSTLDPQLHVDGMFVNLQT